MEFRDLEYFAVVAEHRHLGRAAEALNLSTPALSKSLRRLEKSMEARLVARTPKGVELTPVGLALLDHVRTLRLAMHDVRREAAQLSAGTAGDLRIGASPGFGEYLLPDAVATLLRETGDVRLKVAVGDTAPFISALNRGDLDLIVCVVPPSSGALDAGWHFEILYRDEYVVYTSQRHSLANRKRLSIKDVAQERWTMANTQSPLLRRLHQAFAARQLPHPVVVMESNSVLLRLYSVGAASALLNLGSRRFLQRAAPLSGYAILPVKELTWPCAVGVVYRKGAYLPPVGRRFIEILKATAQKLTKES